jgi:hypothetical protein
MGGRLLMVKIIDHKLKKINRVVKVQDTTTLFIVGKIVKPKR